MHGTIYIYFIDYIANEIYFTHYAYIGMQFSVKVLCIIVT